MGGINDLKTAWPAFVNRPLKSVTMRYDRGEDGGDRQTFVFVLQDGTVVDVTPDWKEFGRPYTNDDIIKFAASKLREIELRRAAGKPDESVSVQGLLSSVDEHIEKLDEAPAPKEGPVEGFFSSSKTGEGT